MPQSDPWLDALDAVQGRSAPPPRMRTVPPTPGVDPPDMFRGQAFSRAQVEQQARDLQIDYETVKQGVIDRGGRVEDGGAMGWAVVNGARVPVDAVEKDDPWLSALDAVQQPDNRSMFSKAYDAAFTPPEAVTRTAKSIADTIDPRHTQPSMADVDAAEDAPSVFGIPLTPASARAYYAGAVEGVGNLLTPGDAILTALNLKVAKPLLQGVRGGAHAAETINRLAGGGTAVRGGERLLDAESLSEGGAGIAQLALGAIGAKGTPAQPQARRTPAGALPPGARFTVTPDGRAVPMGTDVPMVPAEDGSYVRGVPAEYARREVRGLLPPGRTPIVTPPPAGSVPQPVGDPSFVRGVPAEYAKREPRGLLPGGRARFVAGEHGPATPIEQADEWLSALDDVQGVTRAPSQSSVRSQPAAVIARDVDPTKATHEAVTVRQFSGDPGAVDAPLVNDAEQRMLQLMREDLGAFTPQRGRLVRVEGDETSSVFAHGGAGSAVGDDVRVLSRQHVSNDKIAAAIDDLLAGKPITNKLHVSALDAARGYIEGRPGYAGPRLPMEAVDEGGLDALAKRLQQEGADVVGAGARGAGGGARAAVDDFDQFAAAFDEIEPGAVTGGREPGEEGFVTAQLATHIGGAAAGGAAGAAAGDEDDSPLRQGLKIAAGIVAGAAAPRFFGRPGAPAAAGRVLGRQAERVTRPLEAVPPRSGRSGDPIAEPLRGFEPFFGKFTNPIVRDGLERLVVEHAGYEAQRRGTINTRQLGRFANEVRVNVERALPKGTALNAEGITAYARALQATQRKVSELSALVNAGRAADADVLALHAARAEADVVARSLVGARAEAGRALGAFNLYQRVLETGDVNLIRDTLRAPGLREEAEQLARGLAALPDDPLVRYHWLQRQNGSTLKEKVRSYYMANILSGVKTHERNFVGNVANVASNLVVHPIAAGVDALKSAVRGTPRQVRVDELPSQAFGAISGFERGIRDFAFTMRHGVTPDALSRSLHAGEIGKLDVPRVEFAGGGLNPFNIPGRLLDASDTLFRSTARSMETYGLAHAKAKAEGLSGQRFLERIAELRTGTSPESVAIRQQADTFATRSVFQEKPGKLATKLQLIARDYPAFSFVVPFIKTPANIMRQGLEFSPAGVLMQAVRQEGRVGTQAQARVLAGTGAAAALAYYAATGRLSGNGPQNRADRAALMESGWRPNSVRIGDTWVSYQLFQPVSVQASVIANAFEAWAERGAKSDDIPDVLGSTLARSANSFLEQSFLSGLFDFVEALKDPDRSMSRFTGRLASGFVPLSAAVRTVAQGADPVVRQPESIDETVKAGIPGLSEQVQPRIDRFGQVVTREGGPLRRAADPFNTSTVKDDPVAKELGRLGVRMSLPSARVAAGVKLTREQETDIRQRRGRARQSALAEVVRSADYQQLADDEKRHVLESVLRRSAARESRAINQELKAQQDSTPAPRQPARAAVTSTNESGPTFTHPRLGKVRVVAEMANGVVRVVRVGGAGRQFFASRRELRPRVGGQ